MKTKPKSTKAKIVTSKKSKADKAKDSPETKELRDKLNMRRTRRAFRDAREAVRKATEIPDYFEALYTMLTTPEFATFRATEFDKKTGAPVACKLKVDKDSQPLYFYLDEDALSKHPIGSDVREYLVRNTPKRGMLLQRAGNNALVIEYRSVVIYHDHHGTQYAIKLVATCVTQTKE